MEVCLLQSNRRNFNRHQMKPITLLEAIEQHPKTMEDYEVNEVKRKQAEDDALIILINEVISRNVFKLRDNGSVITERVHGLNYRNMERIAPLYEDFKVSTLGNSDTVCIVIKRT
jgi:hypothetical protein